MSWDAGQRSGLTMRTRLRIMFPVTTKNKHAQSLSTLGAAKGGAVRAARLTPQERSLSARRAATARWHGLEGTTAGDWKWEPEFSEARPLLDLAYKELADARQDIVLIGQAAEKGWLAARTAAFAVMRCAGMPLDDPARIVSKIYELERNVGRKPIFGPALRSAQDTLHGACHYQRQPGSCDPNVVTSVFDEIKAALPTASRLCTLAKPKR